MSRLPPDDDYPRSDIPRVPRRKPFEIEGEWTGDVRDVRDVRLDDSKPVRNSEPVLAAPQHVPPASLEERVEHLEKMMQLTWKVVHDLEAKREKEV